MLGHNGEGREVGTKTAGKVDRESWVLPESGFCLERPGSHSRMHFEEGRSRSMLWEQSL